MIKIKCTNCNYQKEVLENEIMESTECDICGGTMLFKESADYLADQERLDNDHREHNEIQNETEGMNEQIDNILISSMINDIEKVGEEKVWWEINHSEIDLRVLLIPIYIEAKQRIKESEK